MEDTLNTMPALNSKKKQKKGFSCDKCEYKYKSQQKLLYHIKSKHEGVRYESAIYKCDKCEYASTTKLRLQKHKKSKHEVVSYKCDKCEYASTTELRLKEHKKSKHEGVSYKCDKCEFASTSVIRLEDHKKTCILRKVVYYKCEECDYASIMLSNLKKHKIAIHYPTHSIREGDKHLCSQCKYSVEMKSRLKMYKGSIQNCLYYFCDQCDFSVTSLPDLKQHKKLIHNEIQFHCAYCDYYLSYLPRQNNKSIQDVNNIYDQCGQILTTHSDPLSGPLSGPLSDPLSHKQSKHDNGVAHTTPEPIFIEISGSGESEMMNEEEIMLKEEENIEDPLSLMKMDPTEINVLQIDPGNSDIAANITLEADTCDLKSEIEIEEDLVLKTESSDISDFVFEAAEISICKDNSFVSEGYQQDHTYAKSYVNDIESGNQSSDHNFELKIKIEIEEDITIKTESSEFLNS